MGNEQVRDGGRMEGVATEEGIKVTDWHLSEPKMDSFILVFTVRIFGPGHPNLVIFLEIYIRSPIIATQLFLSFRRIVHCVSGHAGCSEHSAARCPH